MIRPVTIATVCVNTAIVFKDGFAAPLPMLPSAPSMKLPIQGSFRLSRRSGSSQASLAKQPTSPESDDNASPFAKAAVSMNIAPILPALSDEIPPLLPVAKLPPRITKNTRRILKPDEVQALGDKHSDVPSTKKPEGANTKKFRFSEEAPTFHNISRLPSE